MGNGNKQGTVMMTFVERTTINSIRVVVLAGAMILLSPILQTAQAADAPTTQNTLLDRIQIEDFMIQYYWDLSQKDRHDISKYWTEDAHFDINGQILDSRQAIQDVYDGGGTGPEGRLIMLLSNPLIHVSGDTATVDAIYTGVLNDNPQEAPTFFEQGHDHVELVKADGHWVIKKRVLRNFSHVPAAD